MDRSTSIVPPTLAIPSWALGTQRGTPKSCLPVERQAPITELPDVPIDRVGDVVISIDVPDDIVELMAVPEGR